MGPDKERGIVTHVVILGKVIGLPKVKSAEMQSAPQFDPLQNEQARGEGTLYKLY